MWAATVPQMHSEWHTEVLSEFVSVIREENDGNDKGRGEEYSRVKIRTPANYYLCSGVRTASLACWAVSTNINGQF